MENVKITIDGETIEVPKGTTVLEAIKKLNKVVPTFCYHPKLPIFGGCRICLVYDKKWKNSIIACGTYVYDGMEIETENETTLNDRKFILEMLFTRHPLDCPICDKAGECDLQDWGTYYGPQINIYPFTPYDKVRPEENWESDYFEFVSNRCVLCLRCVSVCENVVGAKTLFQEERGFEILISPDKKPMDTESSCEFCGLCVDICPVGAILFKPFKFNARAWLLKETVSHCGFCSMNCPVSINHDGKDIYRIRSTDDLEVCLGAYLGYDIYNSNRLKGVLYNGNQTSLSTAIDEITRLITEEADETGIILSTYSTNEVYENINEVKLRTGIPVSAITSITTKLALEGFRNEYGKDYEHPSEIELLKSKKVVIIGEDIANINPVLSYYLQERHEKGQKIGEDKEIFYIGNNPDKIKKFNPKIVHLSRYDLINTDIEREIDIDEETFVIYSSSTLKGKNSYIMGKKLGKLKKDKNCKILILPRGRNSLGLLNRVKNLTDLRKLLHAIELGKIKNLIIFGEDLVEHFELNYLSALLSNLKNIVLITQFNDGLLKKLKPKLAIGSSLWFEENGTVDSWRGTVKVKQSIKTNFTEEFIVKEILDKTPNLNMKPVELNTIEAKDEGYIYNYTKIEDFSYFSLRSRNILNLKNKTKEYISKS